MARILINIQLRLIFTPFIIRFRLTPPLFQAPLLGQDELTRRKRDLDTRAHDRSASHLHNQAQTSNKAHDKFVPRRDCACADHSRPSLSTALLSGWSSHLVLDRSNCQIS